MGGSRGEGLGGMKEAQEAMSNFVTGLLGVGAVPHQTLPQLQSETEVQGDGCLLGRNHGSRMEVLAPTLI